MGEREAFGPNLRRLRLQRGVSLEQIAETTKVGADLWAGLERGDFSRWPTGIYARAYVRAYATEIGADPDATVNDFCRLFPNGDRRAERVVRGQATLIGHDLQWKDDLVGSVTEERRSTSASNRVELPKIAFTRTGRTVAALVDLGAVFAVSAALATLLPFGWPFALTVCAVAYHALSLVVLGCSPAVWIIETYLASRHPSSSGATRRRFPRLVQRSETSRLS